MRYGAPALTLRRAALVVGIASMAVAAWLAWSRWPHAVDKGTIPSAPAPIHHKPSPGASTPQAGENPGPLRPISLQIPSVGVNASVVPVAVGQGGALGVPQDPSQVGWWETGPPPGAPSGTAVIDGHVDSAATGPGALFELRNLQLGAAITIEEPHGPTRFRVDALREYSKATLPWQQVFSQTTGSRLVIVTCGGAFDSATQHYADNIVVYATPAS